MKKYKFISRSELDTKSFAKRLASILKPNNVIVLTGELGSGKTKFVEGFLEYFGLENEISSPTFTIVNEYKWGEIIQDALPKDYIHIIFEKDINDDNKRILNIQAHGNYNLDNLFN